MRISARRAVVAAAVAVVAAVGTASIAGAAAPPKFQTTVNDNFLPGGGIEFVVQPAPTVVPTGTYKVGFANNSVAPHVLVAVGGLPADITVPEFIALIDAVNAGAPPPEGTFEAGAVFSKPGQDHQKLFDNTVPGQYGFFCPIVGPNGVPHYKEGFVGLFDVVPA